MYFAFVLISQVLSAKRQYGYTDERDTVNKKILKTNCDLFKDEECEPKESKLKANENGTFLLNYRNDLWFSQNDSITEQSSSKTLDKVNETFTDDTQQCLEENQIKSVENFSDSILDKSKNEDLALLQQEEEEFLFKEINSNQQLDDNLPFADQLFIFENSSAIIGENELINLELSRPTDFNNYKINSLENKTLSTDNNMHRNTNDEMSNSSEDSTETKEELADSDTRKTYLTLIKKDLLVTTFDNIKLYKDIETECFFEEIQLKFVKETHKLEIKYFFRLNKLYKCLKNTDFPAYLFLKISSRVMIDDDVINRNKLISFFQEYIKNKTMKNNIFELKYKENELESVISEFNKILSNYSTELKEVFFVNEKTYNQIYGTENFSDCKTWSSEKLYISLKVYLEDKENSIFIDLFPEICIFSDELKNHRKKHSSLIQFDLFLNLVAFKFIYLKKMIEKTIKQETHNSQWIITDSKPLVNYIFEMKCTFAIFGFNLLKKLKLHKFLMFRVFVIFLKLIDSEVLSYTELLNQAFLPIQDELIFSNNIKLNKYHKRLSESKRIFKHYEIKSIHDPKIYIFFEDCKEKLRIRYDKEYQRKLYLSKYSSPTQFTVIKELTEKLKNYFK
ncbi:hypothetical protein TUBRATIS_006070 [Tubulinosema ratisbonensis]|uniref:Uncharacterized protein n=1 Tax=Tubulinosema ratisbonensis TaxID=291195 RepID=A0A437AP59_9MICR|nr:hypothetical protein TUBRATIS_006070 [Tubulinosema ratisbonensis]